MKYIPFGDTNREVSQVVIGMMRTAELTVEQLNTLIETGLSVGINALDTADIYARGKSEEMLGNTFRAYPSLRERVFLQTKCGIRPDQDFTWYDFSAEHIIRSVEGSLQRLQTDHLDSLLLHRPDALMEKEEVAKAFDSLYTSGKVLNFGVSNMNVRQLELIRSFVTVPIVANQLQMSCAFTPMLDAGFNVNNMNDHAVMRDDGVLEYCRLHNIVIQTWSVLQYGYFGGVFLGSEKYPALNAVLNRISEQQSVSPSAVAIAWLLRYPHTMQAVVGSTRPERIAQMARATDVNLSKKEWYEIYVSAGNRLP